MQKHPKFAALKQLQIFFRYLKFRLKASSEHGVHSPFVFALVTEVIYNRQEYYSYERIRGFREELLNDFSEITVRDFGAGSHVTKSDRRPVSEIAAVSGGSLKETFLLFRLVNRFQPAMILELGTSLGLSAASMAMANHSCRLVTIEGSPSVASRAQENFNSLGLNNISLVTGSFDDRLDEIIAGERNLPFVFFDGNHRRDATLLYFEKCVAKADHDSIFIFDDIYWSAEMTEAWNIIRQHPRVTVTIDLFCMGLVFFRKEQVKQDFLIRF